MPQAKAMAFSYGLKTHQGKVRAVNQDAVFAAVRGRELKPDSPIDAVLAVADGMGGGQKGEAASRLVVEGLKAFFVEGRYLELARHLKMDPGDYELILQEILLRINRQIVEAGGGGMGTTADVVLVSRGKFYWAHAGDGRIYRVREGKAEQLTTDHSLVAEYAQTEGIPIAQARKFIASNLITNNLGKDHSPRIDTGSGEVALGDSFVLTTDGLHSFLADSTAHLASVASAGTPQQAADTLCGQALQKDGSDNISIVVGRAVPPGRQTFADPGGPAPLASKFTSPLFVAAGASAALFLLLIGVVFLLTSRRDKPPPDTLPETEFKVEAYGEAVRLSWAGLPSGAFPVIRRKGTEIESATDGLEFHRGEEPVAAGEATDEEKPGEGEIVYYRLFAFEPGPEDREDRWVAESENAPISLAHFRLQDLQTRADDLSGRRADIEASFRVPDPLSPDELFSGLGDLDDFREALTNTIAEAKGFEKASIDPIALPDPVRAELTEQVGEIEEKLAAIRDGKEGMPSLETAAAEAVRATVLAAAGNPDADEDQLRSLRTRIVLENKDNNLLARRMPAAGRDLETLLTARLDEGDFELRTVSPSLEGLLRSHYGDSYEARPEYYQSSIESIHAPPIRPVGIVLLPPRGLLDALAVRRESGERGDEVIRDGAGRTAEAVLETRGEGFGEAGLKLALDFLARADRIGLRDSDWVDARKDQLTADQREQSKKFISILNDLDRRIEAASEPVEIRKDYLAALADFSGNELQLALAMVKENLVEVGRRLDEIGEKIEEQGRAALSAAAEAIERGGESRRPRADREAELGSAAESLILAASWLGEEHERVREGRSELDEARLALTVAGSRNELLDIVGFPQLAALEAEYDYDDITGNNLEAAAALSALEVIRGRDFAEYRGIYGRTKPNLERFVQDHYRREISRLLRDIDRQPESGGWLGLARDYVEPRRLESIARRMTILYYEPGGGERLPERFRDEFRRGVEELGQKMAELREEVLRRNIGQTGNRWSRDWNERRWDAEVSKGYTGAARARPGEVPAEMDPGFFRTGPYQGVLSPLPSPTPQPSATPELTPSPSPSPTASAPPPPAATVPPPPPPSPVLTTPVPLRTPAPTPTPKVITPEKPEEPPTEVWIQLDSKGKYEGGFVRTIARYFYFSDRPPHRQLQNKINKIAEANNLEASRGGPVVHALQWLRIPNPRYNWEGLPTSRPE